MYVTKKSSNITTQQRKSGPVFQKASVRRTDGNPFSFYIICGTSSSLPALLHGFLGHTKACTMNSKAAPAMNSVSSPGCSEPTMASDDECLGHPSARDGRQKAWLCLKGLFKGEGPSWSSKFNKKTTTSTEINSNSAEEKRGCPYS